MMDIQTIDNAYGQLQQEAQQSNQAVQSLAEKLQAAVNSGDSQAREWLLDLREVALSIQGERQQMAALLQSLHAAVTNEAQEQAVAPTESTGSFLNGILKSSFGQAVATGAGFGIGNDVARAGDNLLKDIF